MEEKRIAATPEKIQQLRELCDKYGLEGRGVLGFIDLTAESFGVPLYTIRELNEEAAAASQTTEG